jgi:hypothetical protein
MDGQTLLERLRSDHETELSRLSSSKALYALTGGELSADGVRSAVAADAAAAATTFEAWADDEADEAAAARFAAAAETAADHEAVGDDAAGRGYPIYDDLDALEGTPARAGGLLGRSLLASETLGQAVGFFVGDADPQSADEFRGVRRETESVRDDAVALLDEVCDDEDDWDAAATAGGAVVEAAYDFYVETLESMGVKPKNVC